MHDATKGRERAEARRNGGLSTKKPHYAEVSLIPTDIRSTASVFAILKYALEESVILDNSVQRGRLLVSIAHACLEALKVGELENRLDALETALRLRK
jgi:hypothetical protein